MRQTIVAGLAAGLLLLAAGCGDEGDEGDSASSADEEKAATALADSMSRRGETEVDRTRSTCTAEAVVADLGVDRLQDAGILTEDLTGQFGVKVDQETAEAIADAAVACYDFAAIVEERKSYYPNAGDEDWEAYIACVDALDPQLRASVLEANVEGGGTQAQQTLQRELKKCGDDLAKAAR